MKIAAHHLPGTPEHALSSILGENTDYQPECPWPQNCTVQWGHGLVPAVPFFEAFPTGTFIRGEGDTIAEAERQAFAKYQRDTTCGHIWGRHRPGTTTTYTNGAAFCRKCGGFRSRMFAEIKPCGWWRKPLSRMEVWHLQSLQEDAELTAIMDRKYPTEKEARRRSGLILRLRYSLFGSEENGSDPRE